METYCDCFCNIYLTTYTVGFSVRKSFTVRNLWCCSLTIKQCKCVLHCRWQYRQWQISPLLDLGIKILRRHILNSSATFYCSYFQDSEWKKWDKTLFITRDVFKRGPKIWGSSGYSNKQLAKIKWKFAKTYWRVPLIRAQKTTMEILFFIILQIRVTQNF